MKYLTSKNAKLILGIMFTNPEQEYYLQELARLIGKKAGVIQKAVNYLVKERILLDRKRGNLRFFRTNLSHPLYHELKNIIFKTIGVEGGLRSAISMIKGLEAAFLYGSFAKDTADARSDIDLCVIGEINLKDLNRIINKQEKAFQREINYVLYSLKEFRDKLKSRDPFILDILKDALFLMGSYEKLTGKP